ncbi:GNAT family protein [Streptomyces sp. NPDC046939]|uniref:GNAT family N-acetyltransferase n=1 Tax=Streptomyces sp. NPDC046939 TaxID=3155376 RepID=UPI00340CF61B
MSGASIVIPDEPDRAVLADVAEERRRFRTTLTHGHRPYRSPPLISLGVLSSWFAGSVAVPAHARASKPTYGTGRSSRTHPVRSALFGIRVDVDETRAGTINLRFTAEGLSPGQVNVAYGLYPFWRGRGLATRAVLLASRYAASKGGKEAVIQVEPENAASASVARRAGITPGRCTRGEDGTRLDWYIRDSRLNAQNAPGTPEPA